MVFKWLKAAADPAPLRLGGARVYGWQLFSLFGLIALGGYFLIPASIPGLLNIYFATFNLLPVAAVLLVRKQLAPGLRLAWYFIAGGLTFWSVGEYLWAYYNFTSHGEAPYPSLSDILFQGYYPLVIAGVWLLARGKSKTLNQGALVDAAIVTCSLGSLVWNFFVQPQLENQRLSFIQVSVSVSLPLMDLLLLSIGVFYLLLPGWHSPSYYFLALSLFITLISDIFYGFALLSGTYYTGHPLTAGWMLAFICWGVAVMHPSRATLGELAPVNPSLKLGRLRFILLGGVAILGPGMFIAQQIRHDPVNTTLLVVTSILLFLLVVARLAVIVRRYEVAAGELSVQAQRQAELAVFSQAALAVPNLSGLFDDTVELLCRVLNIEYSVILELGTSSNNQTVFKWASNNPAAAEFSIPTPTPVGLFSAHIVAEKKALILTDWSAQTEFVPTSFILAHGIRSSLGVPVIKRESAVFGVLLAHSTSPNRFTESDATFLQGVANIVAAAIERKRVEDALQQERDFALQVMNNMGQGLIVKSPDRIIQFVNPAMAQMLGYETEELYGRHMDIFMAPSNSTVMPEILAAREEGITSSYELSLLHKDGHSLYASVTGVPLMRGEKLERVILVFSDITERRKTDEEIQKALAKEKELNELKTRFVSLTSHEFRTPLTSIMTSAELLEHYSQRFSEEKKVEILQRILTSVKYMSHLLDDILIIGRADSGRLEYNPVPLDLAAECRKALSETRFELTPKHQLNFVVGAAPVNAQLDPVLFKRIVVNLLSNAIKYSPKGGEIYLELTGLPDEHAVRLQVKDHGIGILPEDRNRLFDVFHRGKNVGTTAGTGLGLSIVKQSVDLHRGAIDVSSEPGGGSTFTVTLPVNPPPGAPPILSEPAT